MFSKINQTILLLVKGRSRWFVDENGKVSISVYVSQTQFLRRLQKFSKYAKVEHMQGGNCPSNFVRMKEAPSTNKSTNPSTNKNTNPGPQLITHAQQLAMIITVFMVMEATMGTVITTNRNLPSIKRGLATTIYCAGDASECSGDHNGKALTLVSR